MAPTVVSHAVPSPAARLDADEALAVAEACVDAAGLRGRVEVAADPAARVLRVSGPDHFGMLGTTAYATVRVALPAVRAAVALAVARHALGEFHATDGEIAARAAELPLPLALLLAPAE